MQRPIIAVLALASGSLQASQPVVRSIGFHHYMVDDAGKQMFAKADETCAKLGRTMLLLGVPPEEARLTSGTNPSSNASLPTKSLRAARTSTQSTCAPEYAGPLPIACAPTLTCPISDPFVRRIG